MDNKGTFQVRVDTELLSELNGFLEKLKAPTKAEALRQMRDLAQAKLAEEKEDDLTPYLEAVKSDMDDILAQFTAVTTQYNQRLENQKSKMAELLSSSELQKQEDLRRISEEQENVSTLVEELAGRDAQMAALTAEIGELKATQEKQKAEIAARDQAERDLKKKVSEADRECNNARKQANEALSTAEKLRKELEAVENIKTENATLTGKVEALESTQKTYADDIARRDEKIDELRQQVSDLERERTAAVQKANEVLETVEELRKELAAADGLKAENSRLMGQIETMKEAHAQEIERFLQLTGQKKKTTAKSKKPESGELL